VASEDLLGSAKGAAPLQKSTITRNELLESLCEMGVGEEADVLAAIERATDEHRVLSTLLIKNGANGNQVLDALCAIYGLPRAPADLLQRVTVDHVDRSWDKDLFWRLLAIPFFQHGRHLWIAFADPESALNGTHFGLPEHRPFLALEPQVQDGLARILGPRQNLDTALNLKSQDLVPVSQDFSNENIGTTDSDRLSFSTVKRSQIPTPPHRVSTRKVHLHTDEESLPVTMSEQKASDQDPSVVDADLPHTMEEKPVKTEEWE
jgi:hypothetical protein